MSANPRRAPLRGFIANGQTHAMQGDPTIWFTFGECDRRFENKVVAEGRFIANPFAPLCLACVTAIESTVKGKP